MSRIDHIMSRRLELPRKARRLPGTFFKLSAPFHKQGNHWWRSRFADLVERRGSDGDVKPRVKKPVEAREPAKAPELLPRPEGMTRQVQRRLYREACKLAGVPYRAGGSK